MCNKYHCKKCAWSGCHQLKWKTDSLQ